jgi:small-conductance mechanosensitive channel
VSNRLIYVSLSFLVLLGVAGIAAAVAFGLGTRNVVEQLAAGQGLRQFLQHGDVIQYDCYEGTIETVGYTHVSLRTDQGVVTIPNTVMLNAAIVKRRSSHNARHDQHIKGQATSVTPSFRRLSWQSLQPGAG